ncbi:hypothetical protein EIP86_005019 [Pleurotus ostreatoroseus]|nr:hypothetical protein EIP86_005019 [Pleurotus ostreatoroseus]
MNFKAVVIVSFALAAAHQVSAGLIAYGICQTVACYAGAGFTFGTVVAAALAPPAILACNAALGTCSAACATVALLAPTP